MNHHLRSSLINNINHYHHHPTNHHHHHRFYHRSIFQQLIHNNNEKQYTSQQKTSRFFYHQNCDKSKSPLTFGYWKFSSLNNKIIQRASGLVGAGSSSLTLSTPFSTSSPLAAAAAATGIVNRKQPFSSSSLSSTSTTLLANFEQRRFRSTLDIEIDMQKLCGVDLLREPNVNKDLAFTTREREVYKLKGLLPAAIRSQELQVQIVMDNLRAINSELGKYMFLRDLQDHNKRLFYRVLQVHTRELMPIVYTPIVGLACQKYSLIFKRPRGMFITINDAGRVFEILGNCGEPEIKAIVVTDGERILGLGDLGANGMGIPVGKMALYSAIAGIPPELTLPVTLDVGTNNQALLEDPYYIGLKQRRATGPHYDQLLDEFMEAVVKRWGRSCLIQFEDFGNKNAFRLLSKYKKDYCTFNDDIQGTASVAVAGMLASFRKTNTKINQHRFLFLGAGEAALGIANLLVMAMIEDGMDEETAHSKIWLIDSQGLVTQSRPGIIDDEHKWPFAKNVKSTKDLMEIVNLVQPSCLIGAAAVPGAFNESILKRMAEINKNPIIFALSNPTSKAECTAEQAYEHTDGRCVFASGSPFNNVTYKDQTFVPGQGNNAYIFPGVALAVMACQVHEIVDEIFLVAANALAEQVSREDLDIGSVYPPLDNINEVSLRLATRVAEWLYNKGYANVRPEPDDKYIFLKSRLYDALYDGSNFTKHVEESHHAWHQHE
ncbi:NADP-dependent malic enzyme, variant 2 [Dermatophagoides farinae]|uniref:Malic enzyme n=1 Tax=Dermatophagoides farinae TaxID=6954 RepID=A0A922HY28_DERFA|nr:NADP-dependent malic enzyme, variant 2 [Dermatophagoides farinae]